MAHNELKYTETHTNLLEGSLSNRVCLRAAARDNLCLEIPSYMHIIEVIYIILFMSGWKLQSWVLFNVQVNIKERTKRLSLRVIFVRGIHTSMI